MKSFSSVRANQIIGVSDKVTVVIISLMSSLRPGLCGPYSILLDTQHCSRELFFSVRQPLQAYSLPVKCYYFKQASADQAQEDTSKYLHFKIK